ncbi:hypothetical protein F5I97DRAFT_1843991 [Phlebopus sp. FC_14]|nr:hypothetical protein F5I97DRAFT_1843991 [Phlebopus sp. FC_14]
MSEAPYILHVWPAEWKLPSHDPECLAAIMYLQLALPGKFQVAECTNPDLSSNGKLPFLTHGYLVFSSLPAIISFVTSLSRSSQTSGASDIDASLSVSQRSKRTAWYSHIEANMGDLLSHVFYGIDANFWGLTNPVLSSQMSIPQRYYVPGRIRETYRPRLEASGLWSLPAVQEKSSRFAKEEKKKEDNKSTFARVFEREKVLEKARTSLGLYAKLLDEKKFFFGDRMTSIDVYLASYILLLADPPFPDTVLQTLLLNTYPSLVDHARRVQSQVVNAPPYEHAVAPTPSLLSLIPRLSRSNNPIATTEKPDTDEVRFRRMRWGWIGLAAIAAVYNIVQFSRLIEFVQEPEEGDEVEEDVEAEIEVEGRQPEDDEEDILPEGDDED